MTYRRFMAARQLLFEERIGKLMRESDNAKLSEYAKSVAMLKKYGGG
jgi:hypothetical protein